MKRSRRLGLRPLSLFILLFCLFVLVSRVAAQDDSSDSNGGGDGVDLPEITDGADADAAQPTDQPADTENTDTDTAAASTDAPTQTDQPDPATSQDLPGLTTETPEPTSGAPDSESSSADTPDLPSLPNGFTIPVPAVPPTENAPYLQQTSYPEGTVFIAVGAILGAFGIGVIAWRALVAWSINRSVRRAAEKQNQPDATALLGGSKKSNKRKSGKPTPSTRRSQPPGTTMNMEKIPPNQRNSGLPPRMHTPSSSLFFSPTANAGMHTPGHRGSGYLPAGYYASSGTSLPGGGVPPVPGPHPNSSLSPLSPVGGGGHGYGRARSTGPTPPGSPGLPPSTGTGSRGGEQLYQSTSSLNLSTAPQGRAPSAYLDDLFESHSPGR